MSKRRSERSNKLQLVEADEFLERFDSKRRLPPDKRKERLVKRGRCKQGLVNVARDVRTMLDAAYPQPTSAAEIAEKLSEYRHADRRVGDVLNVAYTLGIISERRKNIVRRWSASSQAAGESLAGERVSATQKPKKRKGLRDATQSINELLRNAYPRALSVTEITQQQFGQHTRRRVGDVLNVAYAFGYVTDPLENIVLSLPPVVNLEEVVLLLEPALEVQVDIDDDDELDRLLAQNAESVTSPPQSPLGKKNFKR